MIQTVNFTGGRYYGCEHKKRYSSMGRARMVAGNVGAHKHTKLHAYHCPDCHGYHITGAPR